MARMPMMGGPNPIRFSQESPLHLAAIMCQTNMIRLLLASGASVNAEDGMGRTPLDLAKSAGFPPSAFWIQRSFGTMDPLGVAEPLSFPTRSVILDQQKAATTLLENAGGRSRHSGQHFGQAIAPPVRQCGPDSALSHLRFAAAKAKLIETGASPSRSFRAVETPAPLQFCFSFKGHSV